MILKQNYSRAHVYWIIGWTILFFLTASTIARYYFTPPARAAEKSNKEAFAPAIPFQPVGSVPANVSLGYPIGKFTPVPDPTTPDGMQRLPSWMPKRGDSEPPTPHTEAEIRELAKRYPATGPYSARAPIRFAETTATGGKPMLRWFKQMHHSENWYDPCWNDNEQVHKAIKCREQTNK
jgi:hypothetical protein